MPIKVGEQSYTTSRDTIAFLDSYVLCSGWLDGRVGFAYATARYRYYAAIDRAYRALNQSGAAVPSPAAAATGPVPDGGVAD